MLTISQKTVVVLLLVFVACVETRLGFPLKLDELSDYSVVLGCHGFYCQFEPRSDKVGSILEDILFEVFDLTHATHFNYLKFLVKLIHHSLQ